MAPPSGFSTSPQIPNNTTSKRSPMITIVFVATTPENTSFAYRASTSANPNPMIGPAFVEDYLEEREMELRPEPNREATPTLRLRSPMVRTQRERVVGFEESLNMEGSRRGRNTKGIRPSKIKAKNRGVNLPSLLVVHSEGRKVPMYAPPNMTMYPNPIGSFTDSTGFVTLFVRWIEDYPLQDGLKMPSHIGSYDGKGDPENFLHLFKGAIRMQKWLMPIACHMFTYALKDSARIWWISQKTCIILNYEDVKAKFRSHFSQHKKFTKTHLAVLNIKKREDERTRAFITRYTDNTLQILGLYKEQHMLIPL
nr:reverse transcriptase domain-containing protein [Tanacetum cinerariifolium]